MSLPEAQFRGPAHFATTRWSIVRAAGDRDSPRCDGALAELCRGYWLPVYAHVRRRCSDPDAAQDLTQEFFARLLAGEQLAAADAERGRFRSFLLACLDNFLLNERSRTRALKRGGRRLTLALDFRGADERLANDPPDAETPERVFERHWALALLEQVMGRLANDHRADGRAGVFETLRQYLTCDPDAESYRDAASRLGTTEAAVKTAVHRLRRRFGELLRLEIAQTVAAPDEVVDEIRRLFRALAASRGNPV